MSTQVQHAPIHEEEWLLEDEFEEVKGKKPEKKKRSLSTFLIGAVVLGVGFTGLQLYNYTPMFANGKNAPSGYLPLEDYMIVDEDGDHEFSLNNPFFHDEFVWRDEDDLYTTKGIQCGDSWEQLLDAYGDYYADSIYAFYYDYDEEDSWHHYSYDGMTLKEFDELYVQTGELPIEQYEINVTYTVYVRGNEVAYAEEDVDELYEKRYHSHWPRGSIMNPRIQVYSLDMEHQPERWGDDMGITYLSIYRYTY